MKKMKYILILLFLIISPLTFADIHYVSTSGADTGTGLDSTAPWATLAYAESHATTAGDIIALKKGNTWSGTTALAIKHGGASGNHIIWDGSLWGSGAYAKIQSSANRSDGNLSMVNFVTSGCAYVTFKNIIVDANNKKTFGIVVGGSYDSSSGNIQNSEHDIVIDGCSVLNVGDANTYLLGFLCQTWYTGIDNITVQNCTFDGCNDEQLSFYPGKGQDGATSHAITGVLVKNNYLTNWGRRGTSTGYGLQINNKVVNAVIEDNVLIQGTSGLGNAMHIESNDNVAGYYPQNLIVRRNKFTVTKTGSWDLYIQLGQAITADIYSNIFISTSSTNTNVGNLLISVTGSYTGGKINIYNNTFYARCGINLENDNATTGVFTVKNNIMYNAGTDGASSICLWCYTAGATVHDYNSYYRSAGASELKIIDNTNCSTTAQVLAKEANAVVGDPLFVTVGSDFHLQSSSPVIGEGTDLDLVYDFDSKSWNATPSMGAYEYSTGEEPPVTGSTYFILVGNKILTSDGKVVIVTQ